MPLSKVYLSKAFFALKKTVSSIVSLKLYLFHKQWYY